jgi:hypothetical protein
MKNGLAWALSILGTGCSGAILDAGSHALTDDASTDNTIFVPRQNCVTQVFVDDARVYWDTVPENQLAPPVSLRSCLKNQCATTEVTYYTGSNAGPIGPALDVALDGVNIYWIRTGFNSTPSAVLSCPLSGCGPGGPRTVFEGIDETSMASDGSFLYWTSELQAAVFRCAVANCAGTQAVLAQGQASPGDLTVSGGYAYWIAIGSIRRIAADGTSPLQEVAEAQPALGSLAIREPYVYFTNSISIGAILRCPVTGCLPSGPEVVASRLAYPDGLVADDTNAYWANLGTVPIAPVGSIAKCAVEGCGANTTTLASSETFFATHEHAVAVDDQYVYWVTSGAAGDSVGQYGFPNAAIHRLPK